ncbi:MAG: SDR family oxidoreductase, partial [Deltaproteobacteria bacterium]|nr:SDR family oxidoreductase [Deltaproteobacteria bacterium]
MKAMVTGGAGFIGSHIAERLVADGHAVRIYDNFTSGKRENLAHLEGRVEVVEADVRDAPQLDYCCRDCDVVFHEAAIVSVPYSVEHPQETHDVNIQGTFNVLEAAKRRGVKRVVFACSAAVYGDDPEMPKRESMRPAPMSPYGIEKLTGEHYLAVWSRLFGLETVSLRYFNVFGERQDPSSAYSGVISIFVDRALRGAPVTIFGDGGQYRDFVYVGNVVDANIRAATTPGIAGRTYNVGCGVKTTLLELLDTIERIVGSKVERKLADPRAGDIRESLADIARIRAELGYEPTVGVEEGLR